MQKRPQTKLFLKKLDEFLSCFDPEELVKDGIHFVKFNYDYGKNYTDRYTEIFSIEQLKKEREQNAIY